MNGSNYCLNNARRGYLEVKMR